MVQGYSWGHVHRLSHSSLLSFLHKTLEEGLLSPMPGRFFFFTKMALINGSTIRISVLDFLLICTTVFA